MAISSFKSLVVAVVVAMVVVLSVISSAEGKKLKFRKASKYSAFRADAAEVAGGASKVAVTCGTIAVTAKQITDALQANARSHYFGDGEGLFGACKSGYSKYACDISGKVRAVSCQKGADWYYIGTMYHPNGKGDNSFAKCT